jgi:hypothetical protein
MSHSFSVEQTVISDSPRWVFLKLAVAADDGTENAPHLTGPGPTTRPMERWTRRPSRRKPIDDADRSKRPLARIGSSVHVAAPPLGLEGALVLHVGGVPVDHGPVVPPHQSHQVAF